MIPERFLDLPSRLFCDFFLGDPIVEFVGTLQKLQVLVGQDIVIPTPPVPERHVRRVNPQTRIPGP